MRRKFIYPALTSLLILISLSSCLNRRLHPGRAEIVSVEQVALNDSAIFVGYIRDIDYPDTLLPFPSAIVWLDSTKDSVITGQSAYYEIKTVPGTYTIKCKREDENEIELIEAINNYRIRKNEKVRIDFYLGYISE